MQDAREEDEESEVRGGAATRGGAVYVKSFPDVVDILTVSYVSIPGMRVGQKGKKDRKNPTLCANVRYERGERANKFRPISTGWNIFSRLALRSKRFS